MEWSRAELSLRGWTMSHTAGFPCLSALSTRPGPACTTFSDPFTVCRRWAVAHSLIRGCVGAIVGAGPSSSWRYWLQSCGLNTRRWDCPACGCSRLRVLRGPHTVPTRLHYLATRQRCPGLCDCSKAGLCRLHPPPMLALQFSLFLLASPFCSPAKESQPS